MSYGSFYIPAVERRASTQVRPVTFITYDAIVNSIPNLVSYWKFQNNAQDEKNVQNTVMFGVPETGVPTIVLNDTVAEGAGLNGEIIAWTGTGEDYAQLGTNAAHKTANGTIVVNFQCDTLNQQATLVTANATAGQPGEFTTHININGSPQFTLRNPTGTPVSIVGVAGDIVVGEAYTIAFRWGTGGMQMDLFNDAGALIRHVQNTAMVTGMTAGISAIRFGTWHTNVSSFNGPFGRVSWYNRALTAAELAALARAKTINRSAAAGGTEFFIATFGSDTNDGSFGAPWRTFSHADSLVEPGDTVTILSGTYQEDTIILQTSGLPGLPITWRADVRHGAVILPVNGQDGLEGILVDADYVHIDGLQIDGSPYPQLLCGITSQLSHCEIRNCWVHHVRTLGSTDGGAGILTGDGPTSDYSNVDCKIYNCKVNDIGDLNNPSALVHGVYLSHVNAQCFNNIIYRIEGGGVHAWHRADELQIHNNTIWDCGDSGMILGHDPAETGSPGGGLSDTKVSNNIIIDCPTGIRTSGTQGARNEARNNTCYQCTTATSISGLWVTSDLLTTDPVLVNYQADGSGNYRPVASGSPSSPSVDSGNPKWAPTFDYDNSTRPLVGSPATVDRGAYEV